MNETTSPLIDEPELLRRLAALPRGITPANDLWPSIRAQIAPGSLAGRARRWMPIALAAGLALAFSSALGGAWLGYGLGVRAQTHVPPLATQANVEFEQIESAYAVARESYLRGIVLGEGQLDHDTREDLVRNLRVIDTAVHELRSAIARDPQNPLYVDALLMTREREMELLADLGNFAATRL
jgi:hypothetical protein